MFNVLIAVASTLVLDAVRIARGRDEISTPDHEDEEGRPAISPVAAD